ncbi:ankyrin repeat-containing domain protein, partial [Xylaria flabelliformis]
LEARFDARLLASVINSFSSLGDIPASSVLKFLDRHSTSQRVMLDFLKAPSSPLAKSFIEKAFLAYIEADNADAVNFLLNSQLLDADKAICHRRGDRFTPLEYAAINKSFKVLQLLISKNIDVNKSLQSHAHDSNALLLLIEGVEDYRGTLSHDLLCSVDALLQAEATVLMRTIEIALALTDSRLAVRILKYFASQKPQNIVLHENLLERIIKSLDERNATETIQFIINKCRELGKLQDLNRFALHTRRALEAAVYRGYNELAEVLFPYIVGNLKYATKLLELDPDLNFSRDGLVHDGVVVFDVAYALRGALTHNFDNIAWDLLAVGLTTETDSKQNAPTLLYVAVEKERPEFVKAIIEFGFKLDILQEDFENPWPILETAIECSDNSIFDDVWKSRPHPFRPSKRLYELVLQKGRRDLFFDIVKSSPQMPDSSRTTALEAAVECENESLLDELISLGVPADDDIILRKAVKNHHSMVRPLLERFWKAYPQGRVGYGKTLIVKAIRRYSQSPESLKMMFDWNLVTMNISDQAYSEEPPLLWHAIQTRDCHVVERFINVGNNVNTISRTDRHFGYSNARSSALLVAINTEVIEMVQLLIDHGANVHEPAQFLPRTPLQKAAEMNNIPIVRLLLDSGADVNAAPAKFGGATALQFAAIHGNCEMATILIEHGARQEIRPSCGPGGRYPLEGAAENGRFDMLELLWNAPRDPFDDKQCQKAMKLAAQNGHFGCKEKIEELMARDVAPWTSMLQN